MMNVAGNNNAAVGARRDMYTNKYAVSTTGKRTDAFLRLSVLDIFESSCHIIPILLLIDDCR